MPMLIYNMGMCDLTNAELDRLNTYFHHHLRQITGIHMKYSFSQRTINEWNKLSTDCVNVSSVNMFKNKVDTYLRRADYT